MHVLLQVLEDSVAASQELVKVGKKRRQDG